MDSNHLACRVLTFHVSMDNALPYIWRAVPLDKFRLLPWFASTFTNLGIILCRKCTLIARTIGSEISCASQDTDVVSESLGDKVISGSPAATWMFDMTRLLPPKTRIKWKKNKLIKKYKKKLKKTYSLRYTNKEL